MRNEPQTTAARVDAVRCAFNSLRKEVLGFRFAYPLEVVDEAGPRDSLQYYLYSNALSWDAMRLDEAGIPRAWARATGTAYWPSYIAWYGLIHLGHHLRHGDDENLRVFLKQVAWLEDHAVRREDGAVVWPNTVDHQEGSVLLKAPWVSAHTQGLVISALVRAWRITGRRNLLGLLAESTRVFELAVDQQGIMVPVSDGVFYTETPGTPAPGILDGFLTSLVALYDLWMETEDPRVEWLFRQGIAGLKRTLPQWDYRNRWSWYGSRYYLCPPAYHHLNRSLLQILARLSGESTLAECATRWHHANLSVWGRAEVFVGVVFTKNVCRIKHRTWRQKAPRP